MPNNDNQKMLTENEFYEFLIKHHKPDKPLCYKESARELVSTIAERDRQIILLEAGQYQQGDVAQSRKWWKSLTVDELKEMDEGTTYKAYCEAYQKMEDSDVIVICADTSQWTFGNRVKPDQRQAAFKAALDRDFSDIRYLQKREYELIQKTGKDWEDFVKTNEGWYGNRVRCAMDSCKRLKTACTMLEKLLSSECATMTETLRASGMNASTRKGRKPSERQKTVHVPLNEEELDRITKAAKHDGLPVGTFCRQVLLDIAQSLGF